jgi:hypothetical protein
MLKYQTDLKTSNAAELRKEVEEIWTTFRADVERAKLTNAIISANQAPQGLIVKTANVYNFVYKSSTSGTRRLVTDAVNLPKKTEKK